MRRLIALGVLVLAGCGESSSQVGAADVYRDFATAAAKEDGDRLCALISERMKAHISREEFTTRAVLRDLRDDYGPVATGPVLLDVELEDELSLVALEGEGAGPGARAAILRLEDGDWRVQLTELVLGFGTGDREALVRRGKDTYAPTFHVVPTSKLGGGRHSAVAYVEAGKRSGAIAWTFGS